MALGSMNVSLSRQYDYASSGGQTSSMPGRRGCLIDTTVSLVIRQILNIISCLVTGHASMAMHGGREWSWITSSRFNFHKLTIAMILSLIRCTLWHCITSKCHDIVQCHDNVIVHVVLLSGGTQRHASDVMHNMTLTICRRVMLMKITTAVIAC